jgi:hypothetical protein
MFSFINLTKLFSTIIVFLLVIITALTKCQISINNESECLIHNLKYRYDHLLHSNKIDKNNNLNVYAHPLEYINDFNLIKWKQIYYLNESNSFYLSNQLENQYL